MVATEFSTVARVDVATASCEDLAEPALADTCETSGGEQHRYALLLLGLLAAAMGTLAAVLRSRPASAALLVIGVVVLAIALIGDLPDTRREGAIGVRFTAAEAKPGRGFALELVGGALAVVGGAVALAGVRRDP